MARTNLARAAAVSAGCLALIVAPVAGADPATPVTITFTGTGPLVCGSRPDVTSHRLTPGQSIILANLTGAEATVDVGEKVPLTVASGGGVSVKLAVGEHVLRMVPKCLLVGEVGQTVVVVVPGPPVGPTPGDPGPSGRAIGSPDTTGQPGTAAPGSPGATGTTSPTIGPWPSSGPAPGPAVASVLGATPAPADQRPDQRGTRLLAIIVAICVLGVTAGIIRAIVTHRTRVSLRTMSMK